MLTAPSSLKCPQKSCKNCEQGRDTKEPLRIAEIWASKNLNNERSKKLSFYTDTKGMTLLAFSRENHDLMIQVMGTSFVNDRAAYLPGMPSKALNISLY